MNQITTSFLTSDIRKQILMALALVTMIDLSGPFIMEIEPIVYQLQAEIDQLLIQYTNPLPHYFQTKN